MTATDAPLVSRAGRDTEGSGGAGLLLSDVTIVGGLLNEARYRAVERLFGVPRDQSFLVTVIALGTLAGAIHDRAARALSGPSVPSLGGTLLGAGVLKESVHGIAGSWSKDTPLFNTLLAIALLGTLARPVLRVSFRDVKASSHAVRVAFDHRYGHLIRRGGRHRPEADL